MIYVILGIIVVVALFLIFRDDHDTSYNSYNKSEKGQRKSQPKADSAAGPKADNAGQPKAEKKASGPTLKDQIIGEIEQAIGEAKKGAEKPMKMLGEVIDMAKDAVNMALTEAQKDWNGTQTDVDEQFQDDDEELDLSFLDDIDYSDDLEEDSDTFDITGLSYHCTVHDVGRIVGIVKPEPSNIHDSRAQAVYRNDGKLLGYIPRTQLGWYEDFNEENVPCPFVGEIEVDGRGCLIAEIKVIIPCSREYVEEEIEDGL